MLDAIRCGTSEILSKAFERGLGKWPASVRVTSPIQRDLKLRLAVGDGRAAREYLHNLPLGNHTATIDSHWAVPGQQHSTSCGRNRACVSSCIELSLSVIKTILITIATIAVLILSPTLETVTA
jgi:hypothetical protein